MCKEWIQFFDHFVKHNKLNKKLFFLYCKFPYDKRDNVEQYEFCKRFKIAMDHLTVTSVILRATTAFHLLPTNFPITFGEFCVYE